MKRNATIATVLLATLSFAGCGGGDDKKIPAGNNDALIAELLAEGKRLLSDGIYSEAENVFREITAEYDENNGQAHFGAAMSKGLYIVDSVTTLVSVAVDAQHMMEPASVDEPTRGEDLANLVDIVLGAVEDDLALIESDLRAAVERDPEFVFDIDELMFHVFFLPIADLRGDYSVSEATLMLAAVQAAYGGFKFAGSQTFSLDAYGVLDLVEDFDLDGVKGILDLLAAILDANPGLFQLREDGGAEKFTEAGELLGSAAANMAAGLRMYRDGEPPQSEQPFFSVGIDEDSGDTTISFENLIDFEIYPTWDELIDTLEQIPSQVPVHDRFVYLTIDFAILDATLDAFDAVAANFAGGDRISLHRHLLPIVADIAYVILQALPPQVSLDLPIPSGSITQDVVLTLLEGLIPDFLELDAGSFFATPAGMRDFAPAGDASGALVEWECTDELLDDGLPDGDGSFICATEDEPAGYTDMAHFVGTPHEIPADGNYVWAPLVAFPDPTFNGLMYLDTEPFNLSGDTDTTGFEPADIVSLGWTVAGISEIISSF